MTKSMKDIRKDFPMLDEQNIAYLDSAASSQKPISVIKRVENYYRNENANIHRGVYALSENATKNYENARMTIANYIGVKSDKELILTRGTTEALNLIASSLCSIALKEGDEILLTICEHHSNIVPWQIAAEKVGAKVKFIPLTENYRLDMEEAKKLVNEKTKIMSFGHISNVLGVIHPVKELVKLAKSVGAYTVVDGAQGLPHKKVDVKDFGCDFYCFSGHKVLGPTGIGGFYGREEVLEMMPPYHGGGDMIETVTVDGSTWAGLPSKFEAGTPNIAGGIGLGAAIDYIKEIDLERAMAHDRKLGNMVLDYFAKNPKIKAFASDGDDWTGVVSFYHEDIHPHDLAAIAGSEGVAMRAGHHCAQPLMTALKVPATCRVSPYIYNSEEDIERFFKVIEKAEKLFSF